MTAKMGEYGVVHSNGNVSIEETRLSSGSGWKSYPVSIRAEYFPDAEEAANQVLNCVHPTLDSEEKRRDVIDYVQQLVQSRLNCEVVSYGSVPLKTYLPDGDIDLTVLKGPNAGESLAHDVFTLLQDEEQNEKAEFKVKDTQYIDAEVKLVKCFVRDFVIDISFNQLGGLSTLCFLEQVDRFVGRDHLFKRSIILIKTWCYYESRILGAHHGLISTYALQILVLYIFHHFHSSLSSPLSALHIFLDYYSRFDWENYSISLKGPVCKSSLPDIAVKMPGDECNDDLLFSEEFLKKCLELFSVPSRGYESYTKVFQPKHLNIIDPLKENNNLGRSVHRGNFYRIRSALKFGAHKLGQVLSKPRDKISEEIFNFFTNTRARHEHKYRSSIRRLALDFGDNDEDFFTQSLSSTVDLVLDDDTCLKSLITDFDNASVGTGQTPSFDNDDTDFVSEYCLSGAKYRLATTNSNFRNDTSESFSKSSSENKISETHQFDSPSDLENLSLDFRELDSASIGGESEVVDPLADLTGDYDGNIRSLLHGQLCHGFSSLSTVVNDQNKKKHWDIIRQLMPLKMNTLSRTSPHAISTDHAPFAAFYFDGDQKTRGTGTFFPHANKAPGSENRFHRPGRVNGLCHADESTSFENGSDEAVSARRRHYGRNKRTDVRSLTNFYVGGGTNRKNGFSRSASCRIEFGSVGDLGEELIACAAHVRGSTVGASVQPEGSTSVLMRQRVAGSIHLKNEDEFPPLCH